MMRYLGFGILGFAVLFGISACSKKEDWKEVSGPAISEPTPAEVESSRWGWMTYRSSLVSYSGLYRLQPISNNTEKILCEVEVLDGRAEKPEEKSTIWLSSIHVRQLATGTWAYSNETVMIENGTITGIRAFDGEDFIPPVIAYFINGSYSPFFTYCYPLKGRLPEGVRALIVKPAP